MGKKTRIKTRDHLMVKVINGATKSGVHLDKKKEANKLKAREKIQSTGNCLQCSFPLYPDSSEQSLAEEGFCSFTCMEYFLEGT